MPVREDGKETYTNLLEAACEVFSEKGYHASTIAGICRLARVNVAAVNYYFHDKGNLYVEAWMHAYKNTKYPEPDPSDFNRTPEEQLRTHVHFLVKHFTEQGPRGQFTRLYLRELLNPTGLIQNVWHETVEPRRQILQGIIRRIVGQDATEEEVLFCELNVISQCRVLLTVRQVDLEYLLGQPLTPELAERFADHITQFSLSGIKAIGNR